MNFVDLTGAEVGIDVCYAKAQKFVLCVAGIKACLTIAGNNPTTRQVNHINAIAGIIDIGFQLIEVCDVVYGRHRIVLE